jgi:hypothetical protein
LAQNSDVYHLHLHLRLLILLARRIRDVIIKVSSAPKGVGRRNEGVTRTNKVR